MFKRLLKITLLFILTQSVTLALDVNEKVISQKDFENKTVYLPLNNYRTLKFNHPISKIQLTNSDNINAEFIDSIEEPLMYLKVLGKSIGNESAIINLENGKTIHISFNIMQNLDSIISLAKLSYPNLIVEQANDTIILKGFVKDYKEKEKVLEIFEKASINIEKQLVDMINTSTPSKMIRVKLYAVEVNNSDGLEIKNNWGVSSKNYMTVVDKDGLYQNQPLDSTTNTEWNNANNQRMKVLEDSLNGVMTNAVTLTGGLTGMANYLGKYFNTSLVLKYLATKNVANILDESTLITLENKEAIFHAGGTIRVKTTSSTAEGLPTSKIEVIDYGLKMQIKAKNIMNNEYVDLEIKTSSTKIDWANQVDNIPNFLEKKVTTNVLVKDKATIVLGGLINNENSNDVDKIPFLGDIPVIGFLFKSKAFREGKSELVFFITPEVVDPSVNNQVDFFMEKRKEMLDIEKIKATSKEEEDEIDRKRKEKATSQKDVDNVLNTMFKENTKSEKVLSDEEVHQKRINEILGYE